MVAATQAQRAALYASLVDSMGEEAADTLMDQLPPSGWDQMATKEDLAGVELRLKAAFTEAMAEINVKFAETDVKFAEADVKLAESHSKLIESQAALRVEMHEGFAELRATIATGLAEAARERAEIIKVQARQLYVIVSTIAVATISIWIALFTGASGA